MKSAVFSLFVVICCCNMSMRFHASDLFLLTIIIAMQFFITSFVDVRKHVTKSQPISNENIYQNNNIEEYNFIALSDRVHVC